MDKMKIIAYYLPQFHCFPENDRWWGKGFTEWTSVKKTVPLYNGHNQPRVPLNHYYYDLTDVKALEWQCKIAKEYGVYGFCFYHYWFDGHMLMEKPMEILLEHKEINMPFCISWANEDWTRAWAKKSREVLITQTYGDREDWKKHFEYFYQFFQDERYIKVDGKPLLVIYRPELIGTLEEMLLYWNSLAEEKGMKGIVYASQRSSYNHQKEKTGYLFDYAIEYEPGIVRAEQAKTINIVVRKLLNLFVNKVGLPQSYFSTLLYDYDDAWKRILKRKPKDNKMIPGAFCDWDNSPRYGRKAIIYKGVTVEKFQKYLTEQIKRARKIYNKDMIFMFAWNEWGEGGYLEPDEQRGFGMLEAVRNSLNECKEFPED